LTIADGLILILNPDANKKSKRGEKIRHVLTASRRERNFVIYIQTIIKNKNVKFHLCAVSPREQLSDAAPNPDRAFLEHRLPWLDLSKLTLTERLHERVLILWLCRCHSLLLTVFLFLFLGRAIITRTCSSLRRKLQY